MNILIVEDERLVALGLQHLLRGLGYQAEYIANSYDAAVTILESTTTHLAFLDIDLKGSFSGIDVANYILENQKIPFIYLTSVNDMHVLNAALETTPHAFLFKPFQKPMVYTAVNLALRNYRENGGAPNDQVEAAEPLARRNNATVIRDVLFIKERNTYVRILLDEIHYLRSDDNYVELHTGARKLVIRETLKGLLKQLPGDRFYQTHKSYVVNLDAVTEINHLGVVIADTAIPISARYRSELLTRLQIYS